MGGFQFNGCGAKDYFKKVKFLGDQICPNCKKLAPIYLEKGNFKVSVFWIPTVTLKERYAIMCEKCKQGRWIEDAEAYKILNENTNTQTAVIQQKPTVQKAVSSKKCPSCGAEMEGAFCGICGARYTEPAQQKAPVKKCPGCGAEMEGAFCGICGARYTEPAGQKKAPVKKCPSCGAEMEGAFCGICGAKYTKPTVQEKAPVKKCFSCGAEMDGDFCGKCGAKYAESAAAPKKPLKICSNCGAEVQDDFCGKCGTKFQKSATVPIKPEKKPDVTVASQEWRCSLCGTSNPPSANTCSLCGCEK